MPGSMMPPMIENSPFPVTSVQLSQISTIYTVVLVCALAIVLWDYACSFPRELHLVWFAKSSAPSHSLAVKTHRLRPGTRVIQSSFLIARYMAIAQAFFAVVTYTMGKTNAAACEATRALPFGFSIVNLLAHFVMVLRVYGLYGQSAFVGIFLFSLSVLDFAVETVANSYVQPLYIPLPTPGNHACFLYPSSPIFALAFIAPTIFHHVVLAFTLYKCYQHLGSERVIGQSVVDVFKRDQIGYVLGICLINFVNVVLVLQNRQDAYKLINFLPACVLSQIFLGRIFFSLRDYSSRALSNKTSEFVSYGNSRGSLAKMEVQASYGQDPDQAVQEDPSKGRKIFAISALAGGSSHTSHTLVSSSSHDSKDSSRSWNEKLAGGPGVDDSVPTLLHLIELRSESRERGNFSTMPGDRRLSSDFDIESNYGPTRSASLRLASGRIPPPSFATEEAV